MLAVSGNFKNDAVNNFAYTLFSDAPVYLNNFRIHPCNSFTLEKLKDINYLVILLCKYGCSKGRKEECYGSRDSGVWKSRSVPTILCVLLPWQSWDHGHVLLSSHWGTFPPPHVCFETNDRCLHFVGADDHFPTVTLEWKPEGPAWNKVFPTGEISQSGVGCVMWT